MEYKIATYTPSMNPDFAGNPFIESLPKRSEPDEFWDNVVDEVEVPENHKELDAETIEGIASNIMSSVSPTSIYYDVYCDLLNTIKVGYKDRNPISEDTQRWQQAIATSKYVRRRAVAPSLKFTGYSGLGKTTLIDAILTQIEPVIIHPADGPFGKEVTQIVYLKVDIPGDSDTRDICLNLFKQIDGILGLKGKNSYHAQYDGKARNKCINGLATLCSSLLIGMIIFDEMQNICLSKANEKKLIFKFFDRLTNEAKVPTLKIGTSKANRLTDDEFSNAKRLGVPYDWKNYSIDDQDWQTLVEYAWDFQLLPEYVEFTSEFNELIYHLTRGIPHCLFFLVEQANVLGARRGTKCFSAELLNEVFDTRFTLLKTGIIALRHGNVNAFDDVMSANQYIEKEIQKLVKKLIAVASSKNLSKEESKSLYEHIEQYLPEYKLNKTETKILEKLAKKAEIEPSRLIDRGGYIGVPL